MNWQKNLKIKNNHPLKDKTTIRIGGTARFFCEPRDLKELKMLIFWAKKGNIPVFVLGAGSNLLISDRGVKGLVLRLSSAFFTSIELKGNSVEAGSGVKLAKLIRFSLDNSLTGLEFLSGIPGTLGGGIMMNAGCWGRDIAGIISQVKVIDLNGHIKTLKREEISFGYRKSNLGRYIILKARMRLKKSVKGFIENNIRDYLLKRRHSQDLTFCNAGCIFKNPKLESAGKLIELCKLKGKRIGEAFISPKHANFILNNGNAKSEDVLKLINLMKKRVKNKFNIALEPEIKLWR
ncbi:MAG: UDP-N-acetylenolpyruvoylglucosamine reductase [Candidatus Omnitrophica bacterium ADurb.Bin205]|nr:MAG: UDP-N-acetylenolpyruvoylglucosamine reductase [Candidatus Omnitrophica bacterium ADurb.Bin205]